MIGVARKTMEDPGKGTKRSRVYVYEASTFI